MDPNVSCFLVLTSDRQRCCHDRADLTEANLMRSSLNTMYGLGVSK
jgi:hypothetical protein